MMHHGATLQKLRLARGLTLDDLSRAAGVSKSMLSQIEREKTNPTIAVAWRLANALGVTGDYLLEGTTEEAARANFEDRELLLQFQEVERLEPQEKSVVNSFLEEFLFKHRVQQMARQG